MNFMAVKESGKRSGFVIYLYLKDSAFTAVKRDAKGIFERGVLSREGIQNGYPVSYTHLTLPTKRIV